MVKNIFLLVLVVLLASCGAKMANKSLTEGQYDGAVEMAAKALRNNKDKKRKQEYVIILEEAFAKAKERDLRDIDLLAKDANPRNLEQIFTIYQQLNSRQEKIRPLLPIRIQTENRNAAFAFDDYSEEIVSSKNALSSYLYSNTKAILLTNDKPSIRRAYKDLVYLEQINPGYNDTRKLIETAKAKGSDYVSVYTKNETNLAIPRRLEGDLLDFSTYGLNDEWTVYHCNKVPNINYDYGIVINFRQISISPEQVKEKEFVKEREILVGRKKLLDRRGNIVKDSLGKDIMADDVRKVKATIFEFRQFKAVQVTAKVDYIDFNTNQLLQTFPLSSEFVFENIYARFRGDRRAADDEYKVLFDRDPVPFPSNEQMVFDSGEDLKAKLKTVITRNRIKG